ncbi:unnamed protein product [Lasius platythorax]|uniref:Uncharacterized protein n=1 Tax=Lasius platythorax TaxID=488582 RepID=A0AAV2NEH0_9HYME
MNAVKKGKPKVNLPGKRGYVGTMPFTLFVNTEKAETERISLKSGSQCSVARGRWIPSVVTRAARASVPLFSWRISEAL